MTMTAERPKTLPDSDHPPRYPDLMSERRRSPKKLSISMDPIAVEQARRAAEEEGITLADWLGDAAEHAAGMAEAREAVKEYIAEFGMPDPETVALVDNKLTTAGVGTPVTGQQKRAAAEALRFLRSQANHSLGDDDAQ